MFRVVVVDRPSARDSRFVEILGYYNPRQNPPIVQIDGERLRHWLANGARPSDTVRNLIRKYVSAELAAASTASIEPAAEAPAAQ